MMLARFVHQVIIIIFVTFKVKEHLIVNVLKHIYDDSLYYFKWEESLFILHRSCVF